MIIWSEKELGTHKARIMRRVYLVWLFRKVIAPSIFILPLVTLILFRELSGYHIRIILNNTSERLFSLNLAELLRYLASALGSTELDSLAIVGLTFLAGAFFARRLVRDILTFWTRSSLLNGLSANRRHS